MDEERRDVSKVVPDNQQITPLVKQIVEPIKAVKVFHAPKELTPRMREVVEYIFNNPSATHKQIGAALKIHASRVGQILRSPRLLRAFPLVARARVRNMIPKAIKAQQELIEQKENLMVRDKASARVLESENIFNPTPLVQINQFQQMPVDDLVRIVEQSKVIDTTAITDELSDDQGSEVA